MVGLTGSVGGAGVGLPSFLIYKSLESTREKQFAQFQKDPSIQREVDYFLEKAETVSSVEEFLGDRRLMSVALSAFALEEELNYPARIKAVLTEPLSEKDSLANKLIDPRFKEIAGFFQFATLGIANLKLSSFRNEVIERFHTNEFEKFLGKQNPALREAEYFRRKIASVENTFNIMGDQVLRSVVTYTVDLPKEIALQSVDKQKALIDARVDIKDFKDPEFVEKFIQKFLIKKDAEAVESGSGFGAGGPDSYVLQLLPAAGGLNLLV